jgi:hypothetical protein
MAVGVVGTVVVPMAPHDLAPFHRVNMSSATATGSHGLTVYEHVPDGALVGGTSLVFGFFWPHAKNVKPALPALFAAS